jgi:hypothetical protein
MKRALVLAIVCLALPETAFAHRLDEYLQASRIAIESGRIEVELDLTPGVAIAAQVCDAIDADRDGAVSDREAAAYTRLVASALTLEVDGRTLPLTLTVKHFAGLEAMRQGIGTVELVATADTPRGGGAHLVLFRNLHRSDIGVYLANALVPADPLVQIGGQHRDRRQQELRIDYRIGGRWTWAFSWGGAAFIALAGLFAVRVRRR